MQAVFSDVLQISVTAAFASVVVIIVRMFFKTSPRWITCMLWGVVALRLICPVLPESGLSLIPTLAVEDGGCSEAHALDKNATENFVAHHNANYSAVPEVNVYDNSEQKQSPLFAAVPYVWCTGAILMTVYGIYSYVKIKIRFRDAVLLNDNIRQSEKVTSPFVMGIFKPKIYIPFNLDKKTLKQVILHEKLHIKRLDHIWKPLGFALLCLHWFNPFMWVSYILFCRDVEVACDEKVIKDYGIKKKKAYAMALLNCKSSTGLVYASPLGFGEIGVGVRIKKTIKYRKPASAVAVVGFAVTLILSVCLLTNPVSAVSDDTTENSKVYIETELITNNIQNIEAITELVTEVPTEPPTEEMTVEQSSEVNSEDEDYNSEYYDYDAEYSNKVVEFRELEIEPMTLAPAGTYDVVDKTFKRKTGFEYFGDGTFDPYHPDMSVFEPKAPTIVGAPVIKWDHSR